MCVTAELGGLAHCPVEGYPFFVAHAQFYFSHLLLLSAATTFLSISSAGLITVAPMGESDTAQHDGVVIAGYSSRDELVSVKITVGPRRVFAALCENDRGRFIKLTDGRVKIIVPGDGIVQMRDALVALEAACDATPLSASQTKSNPPEEAKSELVDAQSFLSEGRKFYFDVLENARGRYLKISQSSARRITMTLPINGLSLLREGLDMLLEKAPPDTTITDPTSVHRLTRTIERVTPLQDGTSITVNVVQREIRVLGKRVVFESGANRRGSYIKVSENNGSQRMTIMLPHSAVPEMIELLQEVVAAGDPANTTAPSSSAQI